jgi:2-keto-4-pentenoate hydratase/2-oxohepta-3-ene-1,7-dioic acid hydratase in catechol pathway
MRLVSYHDRRFDQEGELALVIGRTARRVSVQDALSYVFGYTGLLDITMRGGEDRSTRKSFDTFTPMGPVLSTADEFGDPDDVELRCWVSGDLRQKASTRDLIWDVARLVSYASSVTTLYPGDVITNRYPGWRRPAHRRGHHPAGSVRARAGSDGPGGRGCRDRLADIRP